MPLHEIRDLWRDLDLKARHKHSCERAYEEPAKGSSAAFRFIRGDDSWLEFEVDPAETDGPPGTPMHRILCRQRFWHPIWGVGLPSERQEFPRFPRRDLDDLVLPPLSFESFLRSIARERPLAWIGCNPSTSAIYAMQLLLA